YITEATEPSQPAKILGSSGISYCAGNLPWNLNNQWLQNSGRSMWLYQNEQKESEGYLFCRLRCPKLHPSHGQQPDQKAGWRTYLGQYGLHNCRRNPV